MLTIRTFLVRGLLAGLIAGVLTFGMAYLVGEGPVSAAVTLEGHGADGHHHAAPAAGDGAGAPAGGIRMSTAYEADDELVSRADQSTWGLATGTLVVGLAVGGLVGLATGVAFGRVGTRTAQGTSALCAALGFGAASLVPFLKYPANPPSVGQADTIGARTAAYFGFLGLSVLAVLAAVVAARALSRRWGGWNAALAAGAGYAVVMIVAARLFPVVDEVPDAFPASLLWSFRTASAGVQLCLWGVAGIALGLLLRTPVRRHLAARAGSAA
ncbi:CbtA family protein [Nakamurella endophytica]|uniref:Membrane protein n=1 Tax=Nakamurella endophytica TaxID=1748367 RepID=A0A917WAR7_9ACTN|nr:CbtA family protein [Nakamurella endophytica]GGL85180.1 membrane protein [Nakamurella endophytica]